MFNKLHDTSDEEQDEYEYEYEYQYEEANNVYMNVGEVVKGRTEFDQDPNYMDPVEVQQRPPHPPPRKAGISSPPPQLPLKIQTLAGAGDSQGNGVDINAMTAEASTRLSAHN